MQDREESQRAELMESNILEHTNLTGVHVKRGRSSPVLGGSYSQRLRALARCAQEAGAQTCIARRGHARCVLDAKVTIYQA
eukprot:6181807-Pleurochrysis_carterae.AAC.1